jgi:hypothetical protein
MLIKLDEQQAPAALGAMRRVATARGARPLSAADRVALDAFDRFMLRGGPAHELDALPDPSPAQLAALIPAADDRTHVAQFLVVMALVDGAVDEGRIAVVVEYAGALDSHEEGVRQLAALGRGNLAWVRADMQRQNLLSITGGEVDVPIDEWILPYRGDRAAPALAARYRALGELPPGTLGRTFFEFYRANRFAFPGEPDGVNERFAAPHDTTHILSGYDTSAQGELLVSTFTAGMHPREPMSGHILPVIVSWHLGVELVKLAGSITGQLDPEKFWLAWERGAEVIVDVFADSWSLWAVAAEPLEAVRAAYRIPGLDPAYAAHGHVPPWYRPVA